MPFREKSLEANRYCFSHRHFYRKDLYPERNRMLCGGFGIQSICRTALEFLILTDQKLLELVINTQDLNNTPLRYQSLLMKPRWYNTIAEHVPGKSLIMSDAPSGETIKRMDNYCIVRSVTKKRPPPPRKKNKEKNHMSHIRPRSVKW